MPESFVVDAVLPGIRGPGHAADAPGVVVLASLRRVIFLPSVFSLLHIKEEPAEWRGSQRPAMRVHRMLTIQRPECMEGFIMDTGKQLSFNGENTVFVLLVCVGEPV